MILSLPHCWKQKFQQLSEDFSVFRIENHSENFFTGNACRCAWNVYAVTAVDVEETFWPVNQAGGRPLG